MHQSMTEHEHDVPLQVDDSGCFDQRSHSQIGQELWVIRVYGAEHPGYFVDVGGYDGIQDSNTFALETELGWDGVIIEPDPESFSRLKENRRVILADVAVSDRSGTGSRFLCGGELGGLVDYLQNDVHASERERMIGDGSVVNVAIETLTEMLKRFKAPQIIEYLDLDTEGSELAILDGLDLSVFRFGLMTIEHAGVQEKRDKILRLLHGAGYERIEAWFEDWYFSAETVAQILECSRDEARERVISAASSIPVIRVQDLIVQGKAFLDRGKPGEALAPLIEACRECYPNNAYAFSLAAEAAAGLTDTQILARLRMQGEKRYGPESDVVQRIDACRKRICEGEI